MTVFRCEKVTLIMVINPVADHCLYALIKSPLIGIRNGIDALEETVKKYQVVSLSTMS